MASNNIAEFWNVENNLKVQDKLSICGNYLFCSFYAHLDVFNGFRGLNLQHMRLLSSNVQLHLDLKKFEKFIMKLGL